MRQVNLTQKNSLIELYRFLFAFWVVFYHGYFFVETGHFNHGYLAVEFFFLLNGFFVEKSMKEYTEKPFFNGLFSFTWKRLKALNFTVIVGLVVFVIYRIVLPDLPQEPAFGYLWYLPQMLLSFAVVFLVLKLVKSEKWSSIILLFFFILSCVLNWTVLDNWGLLRGIGCVSFGVVLARIPKLKLKPKNFNYNIIFMALLLCVIIALAYIEKTTLVIDYVMICVLFPALIYFSSCIGVSFKPFNFLGSLSFGIYIYQIVLRLLSRLEWVTNDIYLMLILTALVLADYFIKLWIKKSLKKRELIEENK